MSTLKLPEHIKNINHPMVKDAYIKTEFSAAKKQSRVLILEADFYSDEIPGDLMVLLGDLDQIQGQLASDESDFDYMDIRIN